MLRSITVSELVGVLYIRNELSGERHLRFNGNCPCYQLVYKLSGRNRLLFDGKEYEERKGSLRFLPSGRINANYEVYIEETDECIDLCFQTAEPIDCDCFVYYFENDSRIRELFLRLERLWRLKKDGYYHRCMSLVYEILSETDKRTTVYRPSREAQMLRPAVDYLEKNFLDEIDYSGLASMCDISYSYFRKLFRMQYNVSPIQFVCKKRIDYACELLMTGQYSVTSVAEQAKFENVYYFSKTFKKLIGVPPTQFAGSRIRRSE